MASQPAVDMVFGHTKYWYGWTGISEDIQRDYIQRCGEYCNVIVPPPSNAHALFLEHRREAPSMSNAMLRRECLDRFGRFEETFVSQHEDTIFLAKMFLNCSVYRADACWYRYDSISNSCTSTMAWRDRQNWTRIAMLWVKSYFAAQEVKNRRLLKRSMNNCVLQSIR